MKSEINNVRRETRLKSQGINVSALSCHPRFEFRIPVIRVCGAFLISSFGFPAMMLMGCAVHTPRVLEVAQHTVTRTINPENEAVFLRDPASHISIEPRDLPATERRQEFIVRWTPSTVATVRFQYRQPGLPNHVGEQSLAARGRRATTFRVTGQELAGGGPVSAWHVSLWSDAGVCLAEFKSATW